MLSFLLRGACPFDYQRRLRHPIPLDVGHDSGKWGTIPLQPKKCPTSQRNPAPHRNGTLPHFKWNQCPTSTGIRICHAGDVIGHCEEALVRGHNFQIENEWKSASSSGRIGIDCAFARRLRSEGLWLTCTFVGNGKRRLAQDWMAASPECPKGGFPRSCARAAVATIVPTSYT
jgi:hypothetical protein